MITAPASRPLYLQTEPDPVFGFFHPPATSPGRRAAVLLCPPFGWEDVSSYRSRRAWAEALAADGHAALRIDLPGAADSAGSPRDADRLAAWTDAVGGAAAWLHARSGAPRVVAAGWGLGGMLACLAAGQGAPIDDLILWGVPAHGRRLVRELRAFAAMKAAEYGEADAAETQPADDDDLVVAGFVLTAETLRALERIDLTSLTFDDAAQRRVLLLERDGLPVDPALHDHLRRLEVVVSTAPGDGYGAMLAGPQVAIAPRVVFQRVSAWLDAAPSSSPVVPVDAQGAVARWPVPQTREQLELDLTPSPVRETPTTFPLADAHLFGVCSEPSERPRADLALVLLNAGAVRRIGPNRMWVEAARRWASRGVPTLRLDIEGLGDSDGDESRYADSAELYSPVVVEQIRAALDQLQAEGVASRFVVAGLCAGASWAFHALGQDERVIAAIMVNPFTFFWSDHLATERDVRRVRKLTQLSSWRRALRGEVGVAQAAAIVRWVLATPLQRSARARRRRARDAQLDHALDALREADRRVVLLLGRGEPLWNELSRDGQLERLARWPNLEVQPIPSRDHTFRALPLQKRVHDALDQALRTELGRGRAGDGGGALTERAADSVTVQVKTAKVAR